MQSNEIENLNVDAMVIAQALVAKMAVENEEYNQLATQHEVALSTLSGLETTNFRLVSQLDSMSQEIARLRETLVEAERRTESERLVLKGQLTAAQNAAKDLKSAGDPAKLLKQMKNAKQQRDEERKAKEALKRQLNDQQEELRRLRHRLMYLEDFPIFSTEEGETVYLHSQMIKARFQGGINCVVILKYWHASGIGRVITWDGKKVALSDGECDDLKEKIRPSQAVVDFCVGWFSENVKVSPKGEQTYIGGSKNKGLPKAA